MHLQSTTFVTNFVAMLCFSRFLTRKQSQSTDHLHGAFLKIGDFFFVGYDTDISQNLITSSFGQTLPA